MASRNVFYSWQKDSDERFNRYFIEDCLKRAIRKLNRSEKSVWKHSLAYNGLPESLALRAAGHGSEPSTSTEQFS